MLIGANCMKALEPMEIISSRNGGPHAYKTKLGWCIIVSSPPPKIRGVLFLKFAQRGGSSNNFPKIAG